MFFLFNGCGNKAAKINDIEYVQKQIVDMMSQDGYETRNIRVSTPMIAQKEVNANGKLINLFTVKGSYGVFFQFRQMGSEDDWIDGKKEFIITYDKGVWSHIEIESSENNTPKDINPSSNQKISTEDNNELSEAIQSYLFALNKQDFSEVANYLSQMDREFLENSPLLGHSTWQKFTKYGNIIKVIVSNLEFQGDKSTAKITLHFADGTTGEFTRSLHKENRQWVFDQSMPGKLMLWGSTIGGGMALPDPF